MSSPFRQQLSVEQLNAYCRHTAAESLGIVLTQMGEDFLRATMPVDMRTHQPAGLLHGGASVLLAETLASMAAQLCLDTEGGQRAVGLEINANHIRAVTSGVVTGTARALHIGRNTHVWEVRIEDVEGRLVCISRMTAAIISG